MAGAPRSSTDLAAGSSRGRGGTRVGRARPRRTRRRRRHFQMVAGVVRRWGRTAADRGRRREHAPKRGRGGKAVHGDRGLTRNAMEGSVRLGDIEDNGIDGCRRRGLRARRRILGASRVNSCDGEEGAARQTCKERRRSSGVRGTATRCGGQS
jgi:hypothetical protein